MKADLPNTKNRNLPEWKKINKLVRMKKQIFLPKLRKTTANAVVFLKKEREIRKFKYRQMIFIIYKSREWRAFHPPSVMNEILMYLLRL